MIPRDINSGINSLIPFSVLGPRGNRQADLWEAMMNVNGGNRIRSLRYLSGMYNFYYHTYYVYHIGIEYYIFIIMIKIIGLG